MKDIKGPGDFLAWLGGAELKVLAQVPTERTRFVQMAMVLLTTAGIGCLSMMFALHDGVHLATWVAVIGGAAWGLIILNLDRFLVVTMGHARDLKRLLGMALPRLGLAVVVSLVVATPITLRIFAHDISNQMVKENAIESTNDAKLVAQTEPATQAAGVLTQINTDKQVLEGHLQGSVSNPEVTYWQNQVTALAPAVQSDETAMDTAQTAYQCEVDGSGPHCEGASDLQGNGPVAGLKRTEFQQAQQKYDGANAQLQSASQHLQSAKADALKSSGETLQQQQATARAEIPGLQKRLNGLDAEVNNDAAQAQDAVDNNNGILSQLQDLSDAGAQDPILAVAQWVVTLLFFSIEILPVTVKVLLNIGPLSLYEQVLKTEEDIVADRSKHRRVVARQDTEREANKQIAIDEHMRQLEEDLGKRANTHVAAHMEAILDVALLEWSRQVQAKLGVQLPPGTIPAATGLAGGAGGTGSPAAGASTGLTGPQPRLSITAPQPASPPARPHPPAAPGSPAAPGAPTVTYLTSPGGGYALPDDDDGDDQ
jgi:hypothetical protein